MGIMLQAAILVAAILAVRKLFGERLHAYIRYSLWLFVVLRLLIPINLIDSPVSLLRIGNALAGRYSGTLSDAVLSNSRSEPGNIDMQASESQEVSGGGGDILVEGQGVSKVRAVSINGQPADHGQGMSADGRAKNHDNGGYTESGTQLLEDYGSIEYTEGNRQEGFGGGSEETGVLKDGFPFYIIWAAGSLLTGGFLAIAHFRFRRRLRRMRKPLQNGRPDCQSNQYGIGRKAELPIYRVDKLESPCLVGMIRPAVYVSSDMKPDSDYFRYAVIHERVHCLHGDHIWAVLRAVLITVYWFHPFVWIAAAASARDGEIACDYGTVKLLGDGERLTYGEMLLHFSKRDGGKRLYSYGTMLRPGKTEMKERILRLAGGKGSRIWAGILTALLMLAMAGCAFTGVSQAGTDQETDADAADMTERTDGRDAVGRADDEGDIGGNGADGSNIDSGSPENGTLPEDDASSGDTDFNGDDSTDSSENAAGGAAFDSDENISEPRQLTAVPAVLSGETVFGADGPSLDYAGTLGTGKESIIIFHDYFGLVVYDLTNRKVLCSLDLGVIGCNMTQGDNACQVAVSADGKTVWLHPMAQRYMFRYEVEENLLCQLPLVKTFDIDLETEDLYDRYLVTEEEYIGWHSNYLYEEYKDEKGLHTAYIYLYVSNEDEQRLRSLQCVWDDMVFILCGEDGSWPDQAKTEDEFPYRYDGAVEDVGIVYDEPCVYSRVSDSYGSRVHPASGDVKVHEGIDYAAKEGTDVTAAADGIVYAEGSSDEHGIYVVLLHMNGDMTYYCHCKEITVAENARVKRGEKIATVGNTGRSTGAHLHFALSRNGVFIDPAENMGAD